MHSNSLIVRCNIATDERNVQQLNSKALARTVMHPFTNGTIIRVIQNIRARQVNLTTAVLQKCPSKQLPYSVLNCYGVGLHTYIFIYVRHSYQ